MGEDTTIAAWKLDIATRAQIDAITGKRAGETRMGEKLQTVPASGWQEALKHTTAKYVLVGVPEDIGVRANGGVGGAHTLWEPFLRSFCNIQHTDNLNGADILLLGAFDFSRWMNVSLDKDLPALRKMTGQIDDAVSPVIEAIVAAGKCPVVIGGGHNNSFPIIKGVSKALGKPIGCINLDAHSDYRVMEGRHSGNGFRYAKAEGYLMQYAVVGLHRNYNSQAVLDDMAHDDALHLSFYEDIFLDGSWDYKTAVVTAIDHLRGLPAGIELDLDCIEGILSSAVTPAGITTLQARQYLKYCCQHGKPAYLHLTEGAVTLRDGRTDSSVPKLIAYLVSDFIRSMP